VAGTFQEALGYRHFFIFTLVTCIIMFVLAAFIRVDPDFGKSEEENE